MLHRFFKLTNLIFLFLSFTLTTHAQQWRQLGKKIVDTVGNGAYYNSKGLGLSVCLSPDGSMIVGASTYSTKGAWIYSINGGNFIKQGNIILPVDTFHVNMIQVRPGLGQSVSITADNKTIALGYPVDQRLGTVSVQKFNGSSFTQLSTLAGIDYPWGVPTSLAGRGKSLSFSGDGKVLIVGASGSNEYSPQPLPPNLGNVGAAWVYSFNGTNYVQLGDQLIGTGAGFLSTQGYSVHMSKDGMTAVVGAPTDSAIGAAWVFKYNGDHFVQVGQKLRGVGHIGASFFGNSVSISSDGKTIVIGGLADNKSSTDNGTTGSAWVFTFNGTSYVLVGSKLRGNDAVIKNGIYPQQGSSVSISGDGKTVAVGGNFDNERIGATWIYTFNGISFVQAGKKLVGSDSIGSPNQGNSVSLSEDGKRIAIAGYYDNGGVGAVWIFETCKAPVFNSMCMDSNNVLKVSATSNFPMEYQWYRDITLLGVTSTPGFDLTSSIAASDGGVKYNCVITNGCSSATAPQVEQNELTGRSILGDLAICQGDSAHLLASNTKSINWSTGDTTLLISFLPKTNALISFTGINDQNCAVKGMLTITVNGVPDLTLDLSSIDMTCDTLKTLSLSGGGGSPTPGTYLYKNLATPILNISLAGSYLISYSYTTAESCVKSITDTLTIKHCAPPTACELPNPPCTCPGLVCPLKFNVHNGFSPNGDGINEFFFIDSLSSSNKLVIMDKWGNEVYKEDSYNNKWAGTSKDGKKLPDGIYYYYLELTEAKKKFTGIISILY